MRYCLGSFCLLLALVPEICAQEKPRSTLNFPFEEVIAFDFSPDGKTVAVLHRHSHVNMRDTVHKIVFLDVQKRLDWGSFDAPGVVSTNGFAFDSTGTFLIVRDETKTHEFYVATCKLRQTRNDEGRVMVPVAKVWNSESGNRRASIIAGRDFFDFVDLITGEFSTTNALKDSGALFAVSPSGKAVATADHNGKKEEVRLHLLSDGKWNKPLTMSFNPGRVENTFRIHVGHFLPDEKRLLVRGTKSETKLLDFSCNEIRDFPYFLPDYEKNVAIDPGRKLLAVIHERKIHILSTDDLKLLREFDPGHVPHSVAFSPDGKTLATGGRHPNQKSGSRRGAILLWDIDELLKKKSK